MVTNHSTCIEEKALPRPNDLADFSHPPLVEVAVAVQFSTPLDYNDIYAKDIWERFDGNFTNVQQQPMLPPFFEVFGPQGQVGYQFPFGPQIGKKINLWIKNIQDLKRL